jgi:bifunctional UDP-N-acetylglucosamine pyrophosphorylase/glucosamine-1-phosphate N-acetyltransferase
VLREVCGKPMLAYVVEVARLAGADEIVVLGRPALKSALDNGWAGNAAVAWVDAESREGVAGALARTVESLPPEAPHVLTIGGNLPLLRRPVLSELLHTRSSSGAAVVLTSAWQEGPTGCPRIERDEAGEVEALRAPSSRRGDGRDAYEISPACACVDRSAWCQVLAQQLGEANGDAGPVSEPDNGIRFWELHQEIARAFGKGLPSVELPADDAWQVATSADLAVANRLMQDRIQAVLMADGVTIIDPDTTWVEADATIGADSVLYPMTFVGRGARIGAGCRLGPLAHVPAGTVLSDGSHWAANPGREQG